MNQPITPEMQQFLDSMTPEMANQMVSSMTPAQAEGMIGMFTTTILNDVSAKIVLDVKSLKLVCNLRKDKISLWINEESKAAGEIMLVQDFTQGIIPCINGEKSKHGMTEVDGYMLEMSIGKWLLEIYGKNSDGKEMTFDLSPIQIVPYAKKPAA